MHVSDGNNCGKCKFFMQGEGCCFCANPSQEERILKEYIYWNYSCDLFSKRANKNMHEVAKELQLVEHHKLTRFSNGTSEPFIWYSANPKIKIEMSNKKWWRFWE